VVELVGIHRNSAIRFLHTLRERIAYKQLNRSEQFCNKIELDGSYCGEVRKKKISPKIQRYTKKFQFILEELY
jgi:hypothetical protein